MINVDFADVRSVMADAGRGLISIGRAAGEGRVMQAVNAALESPLLDCRLSAVTGLAFSVTGGSDLSLHEVSAVGEQLNSILAPDAQVIFGTSVDASMSSDEIVVTLIATGFTTLPPPAPLTAAPPMIVSPTPPPPQGLDIYQFNPPEQGEWRNERGMWLNEAPGYSWSMMYDQYLQARMGRTADEAAYGSGEAAWMLQGNDEMWWEEEYGDEAGGGEADEEVGEMVYGEEALSRSEMVRGRRRLLGMETAPAIEEQEARDRSSAVQGRRRILGMTM